MKSNKNKNSNRMETSLEASLQIPSYNFLISIFVLTYVLWNYQFSSQYSQSLRRNTFRYVFAKTCGGIAAVMLGIILLKLYVQIHISGKYSQITSFVLLSICVLLGQIAFKSYEMKCDLAASIY